MAITFPRTIPAWVKIKTCNLIPQHFVVTSRTIGGGMLAVERSSPKWQVSLTTIPMDANDKVRLRTWFDTMGGGLKSFLSSHYVRPLPLNYAVTGFSGLTIAGGGTPFTGAFTVTALTTNTIAMSGLPANFIFLEGDFVGLVQGGRYGLFSIAEDVTANGAGAVTVTVAPRIPTNIFTTAAAGTVNAPKAEFKPISWDGDMGIDMSEVQIVGTQKV